MMIGREEEINVLRQIVEADNSSFVAIYGRRRIGKTFLVRQILGGRENYLEVTGRKNLSQREQLNIFLEKFTACYCDSESTPKASNWHEAFAIYTKHVKESSSCQKHILFLDELPWMATGGKLLAEIDYFWNTEWSKLKNMVLIVCGSAASWMLKKIVNSKGGLYNRLTTIIHLRPFSLAESALFLKHKGVSLTHFDMLELYIALGGTPHYINQVKPNLSVSQILDDLLFREGAPLKTEYTALFGALFDQSEAHYEVMRLIGKTRNGILRKELQQLCKISSGALSLVLEELAASEFIKVYVPFGKHRRDSFYKIIDEYSQFYQRWITPLHGKVTNPNYWRSVQSSPSWVSWAGYSFEGVCEKHYLAILRTLGISGVQSTISKWRFGGDSVIGLPGAEIDLVIDRADRIINVCEVKCTREPFVVTKDVLKAQQERIAIFKAVTKTKKTVIPVLISANGLLNGDYAKQYAAQVIQLEELMR